MGHVLISKNQARFIRELTVMALLCLLAGHLRASEKPELRLDLSRARYVLRIADTTPFTGYPLYKNYAYAFRASKQTGLDPLPSLNLVTYKMQRFLLRVRTGMRRAIETKIRNVQKGGKREFCEMLFYQGRSNFNAIDLREKFAYERKAFRYAMNYLAGLMMLRKKPHHIPMSYAKPQPDKFIREFQQDYFNTYPTGEWDLNAMTYNAWIDWRYLARQFRLDSEHETAVALALAISVCRSPEVYAMYKRIRKAMVVIEGTPLAADAETYFKAFQEITPDFDFTRANVLRFQKDFFKTRAGKTWGRQILSGSKAAMAVLPQSRSTVHSYFHPKSKRENPSYLKMLEKHSRKKSPFLAEDNFNISNAELSLKSLVFPHSASTQVIHSQNSIKRLWGGMPLKRPSGKISQSKKGGGLTVRPNFRLEPSPEIYLKWGLLFENMEKAIQKLFNSERLKFVEPEDERKVYDSINVIYELKKARRLAWGLHLVSCEDLGQQHNTRLDVYSPEILQEIKLNALRWLKGIEHDPDLQSNIIRVEHLSPRNEDGRYFFRVCLGARLFVLDCRFREFPEIISYDTKMIRIENSSKFVVIAPFWKEYSLVDPPQFLNDYALERLVKREKSPEKVLRALTRPEDYPPLEPPKKSIVERIIEDEIQRAIKGEKSELVPEEK